MRATLSLLVLGLAMGLAMGLVTGLAGCGADQPGEPAAGSAALAPAPADPIAAALADARRPAGDLETDTRRKPREVLAFFGIAPGMTVLDMYSGGGYYAEILSYLVGEQGAVHAHNNTPYLRWLAEPIAERYKDDRLPNVQRFTAENNELALPAATFDAVLMVLSYHDVYHVDQENGWARIDGPAMLAQLYQAMKPGAVLGIVDHAAAAGAPPETGDSLHRIDPALARADIEAAGFVFEAASDVLANPQDDHTLHTFSDQMRGRTDKFVFRFRKP